MGQFSIEVNAAGDPGCQMHVRSGSPFQQFCGKPSCPDCEIREFVRLLNSQGHAVAKASIVYFSGTEQEVRDDLIIGRRTGGFRTGGVDAREIQTQRGQQAAAGLLSAEAIARHESAIAHVQSKGYSRDFATEMVRQQGANAVLADKVEGPGAPLAPVLAFDLAAKLTAAKAASAAANTKVQKV